MEIITATTGKLLREHIKGIRVTNRIAIFPESGLDANEQAAFVKENIRDYDVVFTLSPFIISDAPSLTVLGEVETKPKFGDSVNSVVMHLWRSQTIGDLALEKIDELRTHPVTDELIENIYKEVGDSIERVFLLNEKISGGRKFKV